MVMTASTMLSLGTSAPGFSLPARSPSTKAGLWMADVSAKAGLPDTEGKIVSLNDFKDAPALLVVFMCNHCPFVKHVLKVMVELVKEYQQKGVAVVGINSNDVASFPDDRPEMMTRIAKEAGFTFPYLYDETQEAAQAYRAACTPDFFLFDKERRLVYRGQMDDSRPGNNMPVTGTDLRAALDAVLAGRDVNKEQKPSMGCNIKWKQANVPDYAK